MNRVIYKYYLAAFLLGVSTILVPAPKFDQLSDEVRAEQLPRLALTILSASVGGIGAGLQLASQLKKDEEEEDNLR